MACPFFMPTEKWEVLSNRPPLPLGGGWRGICTAPDGDGIAPDDDELREFCNLGYASSCPHLPAKRSWDAVRFAIQRGCEGTVLLQYVCEFNHRPSEHGVLEYNPAATAWTTTHRDRCVQKMAQCYLETYLERRGKSAT